MAGDPPLPERLTYAIGDIHGRRDKLDALLTRIEEDRCGRAADIVFLGDLVDRGPDSAGVIQRIMGLTFGPPVSVICLMGNHDRMMLDFMSGPERRNGAWLRIGGQDTLASFGVFGASGATAAKQQEALAEALRKAVGDAALDWLRARPLWWRSGNLVAVHALTDPDLAMDAQEEQVLLWARPKQYPAARRNGEWVVHGHTIVPEPEVTNRRIAVDTGAWRGGPLTAAAIGDGTIRFLSDL